MGLLVLRHFFGSYVKGRDGMGQGGVARLCAIVYSYILIRLSLRDARGTNKSMNQNAIPGIMPSAKPLSAGPAPLRQTQKYCRYASLVVLYILTLSFVYLVISIPETTI